MTAVFSYSCAGQHGENQDAFRYQRHPRDPGIILGALADGQGGRAGAAAAANLACQACIDAAARCSARELRFPEAWQAILRDADQAVARDIDAGFTTLIGFCASADGIYGGSCGDSAAMVIQAGHDTRILTAAQPRNPPVGSGRACFGSFAATFGADPAARWMLLAVSDGVWKYTGWGPLLQIETGQSGEQVIEALLRGIAPSAARPPQDDVTILIVADRLP